MVPTTNTSPSRYQPNPVDDRRLQGAASTAYLQLAVAIEAIGNDENGIPTEAYVALPASARRAVVSAERALRRAAYSVVAFAPEPEEAQSA